jgi:hypothetical protein
MTRRDADEGILSKLEDHVISESIACRCDREERRDPNFWSH